jgi:hypothetical protein
LRRRAAFLLAASAAAGTLLAACAERLPAGATFDPASFFDGRATSRGTVATALVFRQPFTADFQGRRDGGALVLDERFHFPAKRRLQRWRLRPSGGGGIAGSVETEGRSGALHPPVPVEGTRTADGGIELRYDGFAPGGDARLHFRHRMVLQADGTVLNRVCVSKFGIPVAGARVVFERVPAAAK